MKKLLVSILVLSAILIGYAAEPEKCPFDFKKKPKDEAERKARQEYIEMRLQKYAGGYVIKPGSKQGQVVYVNCQKRADIKWIEYSAEYFRKVSRFDIVIEDGEFNFHSPKIHGNASLFIVDDENLPPFLIAPENQWTLVNIAPLAKNAKPAFFEARVKKELSRGFAALCGGLNSSYPDTLVGGMTSPEHLDKFVDQKLPVDVIARFTPYMENFGVTPAVISTFRNACKQGWAPAPTNDYQRAIWNEIHNIPSDPIKITP